MDLPFIKYAISTGLKLVEAAVFCFFQSFQNVECYQLNPLGGIRFKVGLHQVLDMISFRNIALKRTLNDDINILILVIPKSADKLLCLHTYKVFRAGSEA